MLSNTHEEKQWTLIKRVHAVTQPLGLMGVLFGSIALAGYSISMDALYRPFMDGPATHPLTAVCILLIGLALCFSHRTPFTKWLQRCTLFGAILTTIIRIYDIQTNSMLESFFTPFYSVVLLEQQQGFNNSMGLNSAVVFLFIATSILLYSFKRPFSSQLVASISVAIPMVSFTGYAYQLDGFYGQMSMLTATGAFILAVAALAMSAHVGGLRAVLSPYLGGKIARIQSVVGYLIPTLFGYIVAKSLTSTESNAFGVFVVVICWFIIIMVGISAIYQEQIDSKRRKGERMLAKAALRDPLTGLSNRRRFTEFGEASFLEYQSYIGRFWLLILDIDYFKNINDTAGHHIGDLVLKKIGHILQKSVRSGDLVSRIGGEEFSVILVNASQQEAERVAERIRQNIEYADIEDWTEDYGAVTASIGCATNTSALTFNEVLTHADQALYDAKLAGRNRVAFAKR